MLKLQQQRGNPLCSENVIFSCRSNEYLNIRDEAKWNISMQFENESMDAANYNSLSTYFVRHKEDIGHLLHELVNTKQGPTTPLTYIGKKQLAAMELAEAGMRLPEATEVWLAMNNLHDQYFKVKDRMEIRRDYTWSELTAQMTGFLQSRQRRSGEQQQFNNPHHRDSHPGHRVFLTAALPMDNSNAQGLSSIIEPSLTLLQHAGTWKVATGTTDQEEHHHHQ